MSQINAPAYVLELPKLVKNLELLKSVQERADIDIILALKGFAMWRVFPLVRKYLPGATASSLHEARLIYEEMGVRAHTYNVAYLPEEFEELCKYSSHLVFNSLNQFHHFYPKINQLKSPISCGLRVNPEYSEVETELYNPAATGSRLGEIAAALPVELPAGIEGIHFHTLCESTSYDLEKTLEVFEAKFGKYFPKLKWVNFGGGHLMTKAGYDIEHLVQLLTSFKKRHPNLHVILEPGSAIAWQTGYLLTRVMDIHTSGDIKTAILDVSFTAHMPDTLEMPYRPEVRGAVPQGSNTFNYRLGGVSCLAGDYLAEYSFTKPLEIGSTLILEDMIHYTMVKTSTFNGVRHPDIGVLHPDGRYELVRRFGYEDYKNRLS